MNAIDNNIKGWEVELIRTYTTAKSKAYVYGIIYSKTIINPVTGLYDDDYIMTRVKACDVLRFNRQLCFISIVPDVKAVTLENDKLKPLTEW